LPISERERLSGTLADRYAVDREIGRGGMATVYLARDLKHDRLVAVKVLNPELGAVLGVERFLSEIRVTANLQHPNLLPLFDSGEAAGELYYVMPFVEGESLRTRLDREKQLPINDALHIALAVANALDYAHAHGVIHRDLKPENILLQHGQPMVADFGIALAISKAGGARVTQTGLSLGTPEYMSPEQAAGDRAIDGRSDIYSLGAMLFEMLAGETPHTGTTVQAIVAKVLTERPRSVRSLRDTVPVHIDRAIEKSLAKLPADRIANAKEFIFALERKQSRAEAADSQEASPTTTVFRRSLSHPLVIACAAGLVLVGALLGRFLDRPAGSTPDRVVRFSFPIPPGAPVGSSFGPTASISPDGRKIVYLGTPTPHAEIWIRDLDQDAAKPVVGSTDGYQPRFSPDGRWILWFNSAKLTWFKTALDGGPVSPVVSVLGPWPLAWYAPDSVVYSVHGLDGNGHLYASSMSGGPTTRFLKDDSTAGSVAQASPASARDGQTLFFVSRRLDAGVIRNELAYTTLDDRHIHTIPVTARAVLGYAAGAVIYAQDDGSLMALPFDLRRHRTLGAPVATNETVQVDPYAVKAALSENGDLVAQAGSPDSKVVLVGGKGNLAALISDAKQFSFPRYSPDGTRIAFSIFTGSRTDVWIYTIASASLDRLTTQGTDNQRPEWSPDGAFVLYRSNRSGPQAIWRQRADGSGDAEQISPRISLVANEGVLSPDGHTLMYRVDDETRARDIYTVSLEGDRTPKPYITTEFDEFTPRFSPDGKWVAYVSNESGADEVYVRRFPGPGGRTLVSAGGGEEPLWSHDGRRVYYRRENSVFVANIALGGNPMVTSRDTVATGQFQSNRFHPMYDVSPDGRLLMLQATGPQLELTVVLNWAQGLAARVKAKK
jgi:serine/threonine protein kinase/Tol biopolymer transport system component